MYNCDLYVLGVICLDVMVGSVFVDVCVLFFVCMGYLICISCGVV